MNRVNKLASGAAHAPAVHATGWAKFAVFVAFAAAPALGVFAEDAALDGVALYAKTCASCHGSDGRGETAVGRALHVQSLASSRWASAEAATDIAKAIRDGVKPGMRPLKSELSEAQIAAIAAAVQALAKAADPSAAPPR